jgi:hypothetical protein
MSAELRIVEMKIGTIACLGSLLFACIALLHSAGMQAQGIPDQEVRYDHIIRAEIDLVNNSLSGIETDSILEADQLYKVEIALTQGELVVAYVLMDPDADEQHSHVYEISATIRVNNEELRIRPDKILGDYGRGITTGDGFAKKFIVTNLVEDYISLKGEFILSLTIINRFGVQPKFPFNCNIEPEFTSKQKIPYASAAVVGTGLIVWGVIKNSNALDIYNNEYLPQSDPVEAQPFYDKANNEHVFAQVLMFGGGAILATDLLLFYLRSKNYKKRRAMYEKYCVDGNKIGFSPSLERPTLGIPSGSIGISLTYTF